MTITLNLIGKIKNALENISKESELYTILDENISSLRERFQSHRKEFNHETISFLKKIEPIKKSLLEFQECIEELEFLDTRDRAEILFYEFNEIAERLKPYKVAMRVEKEARELRSKLATYPSSETKERKEELQRRIVTLQVKAKDCRKCDTPMVLRGGDNGYFWGCSNFPDCWSRYRLSKKEKEFLFE